MINRRELLKAIGITSLSALLADKVKSKNNKPVIGIDKAKENEDFTLPANSDVDFFYNNSEILNVNSTNDVLGIGATYPLGYITVWVDGEPKYIKLS